MGGSSHDLPENEWSTVLKIIRLHAQAAWFDDGSEEEPRLLLAYLEKRHGPSKVGRIYLGMEVDVLSA